MELDEQLRTAYQEATKDWMSQTGTKEKILDAIRSEPPRKSNRKRWLVASVLAAVLIIPTGAYAGYTYLSDGIYGSQHNITAMGGTAEDYLRLEAKLQAAKTHFSEEEFSQYMGLLKQMGQLALKYADHQGQMYPEQWSVAEQDKYNQVMKQLEPFFEKLESAGLPEEPKELMDQEQFWTEQLEQAEKSFKGEQFAEFKSLFEQMKQYEAMVMDKDGGVHEERLSVKQKEELDQVRERILIYLEKLGLEVREPGE